MSQESYTYLILPSNVISIDEAKPNHASHFITPLPKALELDQENSEVALIEINYPHSWSEKTVSSLNCSYKVSISNLEDEKLIGEFIACSNNLQPKKFESIKEIIKYLNSIRPGGFKGFFRILSEDESNGNRICIDLNIGDAIHMEAFLSSLLGFEKQKYFFSNGQRISHKNKIFYRIIAEKSPDVRISMYNLFIYCNLVKETLVGDVMVPILRTVPVESDMKGKYVTKSFETPRYHPISSSFFQFIEIMITNDLGEKIDFRWGKVIAHLHIKRKVTE